MQQASTSQSPFIFYGAAEELHLRVKQPAQDEVPIERQKEIQFGHGDLYEDSREALFQKIEPQEKKKLIPRIMCRKFSEALQFAERVDEKKKG